jgi:hypothetical protein
MMNKLTQDVWATHAAHAEMTDVDRCIALKVACSAFGFTTNSRVADHVAHINDVERIQSWRKDRTGERWEGAMAHTMRCTPAESAEMDRKDYIIRNGLPE